MAIQIFPTNRLDPQVDPPAENGLLTKESLPLFTPLIVDRVDRDQDHPHGKEMQKSKMAVWGGLTNSSEKKRHKQQRKKGKI